MRHAAHFGPQAQRRAWQDPQKSYKLREQADDHQAITCGCPVRRGGRTRCGNAVVGLTGVVALGELSLSSLSVITSDSGSGGSIGRM